MSTRSLTRINEGEFKYINMYRQFDGYPSNHGKKLFEFLKNIKLLDVINTHELEGKTANGPGCLAAQLVAHFKQHFNGIYLLPTELFDCGQEYEYVLTIKDDVLQVTVFYDDPSATPLFEGTLQEFGVWCNKDDVEEEECDLAF